MEFPGCGPVRSAGQTRQLARGRTVVYDLAGLSWHPRTPLLVEHTTGSSHVLGYCRRLAAFKGKLIAAGEIAAVGYESLNVVALLRAGVPYQASIGATIDMSEELGPGQVATVNGRVVHGPLTIARRAFVREVSACVNGADRDTVFQLIAHGKRARHRTRHGWETFAQPGPAKS
jgi:hypothetical protein